jgi:4-amino-4-deoxy-L-arabinose transferase-like glycosyltransferase
VLPEEALNEIWTPMHVERLARTYWRFLTRVTLGLIRVVYTLHSAPWPPTGLGDQVYYLFAAQFLAHGQGFIDPFLAVNQRHAASVGHPPFYVVVLAGVVKVFGNSEHAMRLAGSVFGGVTIVALAFVARRLAGDRTALIAAGLAAVYSMLITADGAVMSESLYGALMALSLLGAYRLVELPSVWRALGFGVVVGPRRSPTATRSCSCRWSWSRRSASRMAGDERYSSRAPRSSS